MSKFIPNSFQVPNAFIDEMLYQLSGNACKIYLLIVRKTRGWNKQSDRISYSQIQKLTGIGSPATVDKAVSELVNLGLIIYKKGNEKSANEYRLNDDFCTSKNEVGSTSKNEVATSKNEVGGTSKNEDTEIHNIKYTNKKNNSNSEHAQNPTSENQKTQKSKSSLKTKKYTAQDLANLKLSDFGFSEKDFKDYPNLGEWIFENMDLQIAGDYLLIRQKPLTLTALKMIVKEASKAKLTLCQALEVCITTGKGWQTFKAEWYSNLMNNQQQQGYSQQRPQAQQAPRLDFVNRVLGKQSQPQQPHDYINGEWQ